MIPIRSLTAPLDVGYLATVLLTALSGVYLTRLGVSPVYVAILLGSVTTGAWMWSSGLRAPIHLWVETAAVVVLLLPLGVYQASLQTELPNVLNLVLAPLLAVLIPLCAWRLNKVQLVHVVRLFILVSLVVLTAEALFRLTHPEIGYLEEAAQHRVDIEDIAFYAYKLNSLMYVDSNFVGLQLAVLIAFLLALSRSGIRIPRFWFWIAVLLVLATLSRASIFACIALPLLIAYVSAGWFMRIGVAAAAAFVFLFTLQLVQDDPSLQSKFFILEQFLLYLESSDWYQLLFGVGVGRAFNVLSIGAHNVVASYVIEIGLVPSMILWGYLIWLASRSQWAWLLLAAWIINGFSLTTFAVPYLYASLAMLRLLEDKRVIKSGVSRSALYPMPFPQPTSNRVDELHS